MALKLRRASEHFKKLSDSFSLAWYRPRLRLTYKGWPSKRGQLIQEYTFLLSCRLSAYIEPESIDTIEHGANAECHDFTPLLRLLRDYISRMPLSRHSKTGFKKAKGLDARIHALSRIRSRIPPCCSRRSAANSNLVQNALIRHCSLGSLAWLCRGELGYSEVTHLNGNAFMAWLQWIKLNASNHLPDVEGRFVLLAESGLRLDHMIAYDSGESVLYHILQILQNLPGHQPFRFMDCLGRLQRYTVDPKLSTTMSPALRFFLTGHGLSDGLGEPSEANIDENWTTALHQSAQVGCYEAVETLVLGGFEVNALDKRGQTALQSLYESPNPFEPVPGGLARDRIIALLRQRPSKLWDPSDSHNLQRRRRGVHQRLLPIGWTTTTISDKESQRFLYVDRHFGSLTLIKPKFSFFSDQRLALGFRQIALPGQTYYLDLLRFITPPPSLPDHREPVQWVFSRAWYETDAAQMDAIGVYTVSDLLSISIERIWAGIGTIINLLIIFLNLVTNMSTKIIRYVQRQQYEDRYHTTA